MVKTKRNYFFKDFFSNFFLFFSYIFWQLFPIIFSQALNIKGNVYMFSKNRYNMGTLQMKKSTKKWTLSLHIPRFGVLVLKNSSFSLNTVFPRSKKPRIVHFLQSKGFVSGQYIVKIHLCLSVQIRIRRVMAFLTCECKISQILSPK